jgi:hypothetical protein
MPGLISISMTSVSVLSANVDLDVFVEFDRFPIFLPLPVSKMEQASTESKIDKTETMIFVLFFIVISLKHISRPTD